jgi:hypothetical protein
MAKNSNDTDLLDVLHARGLRKRVARTVDDAISETRKHAKPPKAVRSVVKDLRGLADEIEDRATGGKRAKRRDAALKGAATRRKKSRQRSEAAKRGARTRARHS